ncbi:hypothetical protein [Clostridium omnivorum]|uniref:Uncharacterized protein n=1 Tax=Clostridium omnivorum TaxID=1604902 RepID=A0ABQ5N8V2_9CLOT|nr:hypothetical protein [Clostridium sp. E14]GLC31624.1 hypothetical protein bsdE14_30340 [Clostridium sp. E14]
MLKSLKKYFYLFIIPICLIIGVIRKIQLDNFDKLRFGYVNSSGSHTLTAFILVGVYFTVVSFISKQLYGSNYAKEVKVKSGMFFGVLSICVLFIAASFIR